MKRLLLIALLFVPMLIMAQDPIPLRDTITYERDTIIKIPLTDDYVGHIYYVVDSLTGTLDGVAQLVVADDLDNNSPTAPAPADSLFIRYTTPMTTTIDANGAYSFAWDLPLGYDWLGLKITINNITKWHIGYKVRLQKYK